MTAAERTSAAAGVRPAPARPAPADLRGVRIGFLFNHDAPHQIAHGAPIAFELSRLHPECRVVVMTTSNEQADALASIATRFPSQRCELVTLRARGALGGLGRALGKLAPVEKVALLRSHAAYLDGFSALVVPEKTSLMLRSRFGCTHPLLIHTRHGAGDRAIGFDRQSREFDFVLLAGEKIRRRLAEAGALAPHYAIVGYPKFDAVGSLAAPAAPFFGNGRPTVVYNPHCSPSLSSWFPIGLAILEAFRRSQRFNLIFAPHVMLFRKRLQFSLDPFAVRFVRDVPREYFACDHIHVDLGSVASTDMTYTSAADLYLGDVSSQVCEFLLRPRPCLFANPHRFRWQGDPSFEAWQLGPVFEDVGGLEDALDLAFRSHGEYVEAQRAYIQDTFDLQPVPSARRAAEAIASFLAERGPAPRPGAA